MSARSEIAAVLAAEIPEARTIGYAKSIDAIAKGQNVLMVYRESVAPSPIQSCRTETIIVWCAVPETDPAVADDRLDPLLDQVLHVLETSEPLRGLAWTTAEREALADSWPAYKVSTQITVKE